MFTAMILACTMLPNGESNKSQCLVFALPNIFEDLEACTLALQYGIPQVEGEGWYAVDYDCYDWSRNKGTKL